jgi:exodeoxyribonuclease X
MSDHIKVIDCETTGTDDDAKLVEVAYVYLPNGRVNEETYVAQSLVDPGCEIPATAKAVHHIDDHMVQGKPSADWLLKDWHDEDAIYVAHNARFDKRFLGVLGSKWICTYKCSVVQWPDAPGHGNQVLSYWLKLRRPPKGSGHAHRALYDAWTTAYLYRALMDAGWTVERMLEVSEQPALLPCFRFGKHANEPIADVPSSYLKWMSGQDFDEDVMHTIKVELQRRDA